MSEIENPLPAQAIIDRLSAVDREHALIDIGRVERALQAHFRGCGLAARPVCWMVDAEAGYLTAALLPTSAAWEVVNAETVPPLETVAQLKAWLTARGAAWSVAWTAVEAEVRQLALHLARFSSRGQQAGAVQGAWSPGWSAASTAVRCAAVSAVVPYLRTASPLKAIVDRELAVWLPFVDAFEAGLWLFWVLEDAVIAVPRPAVKSENGRLHCATGPAVSWPDGAHYYFWRGISVPARVILHPENISAREIVAAPNAEIRRMMLERVGYQRFLLDLGARPIHTDQFGALYRVDLPEEDPLALVHVTNATPEPDGTRKRYILRVPPTIRTARAAVAWTFGLRADKYMPASET